ncbi:MAG TPA: DUF2111 domain-containing protein [Methanobacteriaceae archaeon]|nr:DUF2111 domain-containing protein [Methanobacteriaceae archaeon]
MNINSASTGNDLEELALAIHELVNRLPLTMRTKTQLGVRVEEGKVIDYNYTGPALEKVILDGKISHDVPKKGPYKGIPVMVVPIFDKKEIIAAVGVVDTTQGIYSDLIQITKRPEEINKGD